jgi:hypothetical protein
MGWSYRKSKSLGGGFRLSGSTRGARLSGGSRALRLSVGRGGAYMSTGIGGLRYRRKLLKSGRTRRTEAQYDEVDSRPYKHGQLMRLVALLIGLPSMLGTFYLGYQLATAGGPFDQRIAVMAGSCLFIWAWSGSVRSARAPG